MSFIYLALCWILANKNEEDEEAPEQIATANDPEDKLWASKTLHVQMLPMSKMMDALKYPQNSHNSEQFAVE